MPELVGKTALITGGTAGLGRAMAERFLDEGASVVITGRDARLGAEAETALARGAIRFLRADAGEPDQARASVDETVRLFGGLDILVNNAGIGVQAGLLDTPLDAYDRVMDVNASASGTTSGSAARASAVSSCADGTISVTDRRSGCGANRRT